MSSLQIVAQQQCCNFSSLCHLRPVASVQCVAPARTFRPPKTSTTLTACSSSYCGARLPEISLKLSTHASGFQKRTPVCLFGGKGKSENDDQGSPFKALEKAIGNLRKEQSVEDLLRKQMEKQEYYDDGGSGGSGPRGGGGGGGGGDGGGDGSGGSEGESLSAIWNEVVQVILATIGFVFLYMLIIEGEEITTFGRDIIRFIFTRQKSIRLGRLIDDWVRFFQSMTETKEEDPYWLERAILTTTTWWDGPAKYKLLLRRYLASRSE